MEGIVKELYEFITWIIGFILFPFRMIFMYVEYSIGFDLPTEEKEIPAQQNTPVPEPDNQITADSIDALIALGFGKKDAKEAVSRVLSDDPHASTSEVVKRAIRR